MKAMILAAGLGTRLKPWTDHHPKALVLVNGKSLLQRNIEYLQKFGIKDLVVNVHHFADQLVEAIETHNGWGSKVIISDESGEVLETGGGLLKAAPYLMDGAFLLLNADILTDLDLGSMIASHHQHKPLATLATSRRTSSRYLLFNDKNELCGWKNMKTEEERIKSDLLLAGSDTTICPLFPKAFSGIHVIEPAIFSLIKHQGKFSIIDAYLDLMQTQRIMSFDHSESKFIDVGKPYSITNAEAIFA